MVINGTVWLFLSEFISDKLRLLASGNTEGVDADLVVAFKAGDEAAFTLVFEQNFSKLYAFAYKMLKSREQAEEIVHDAFLNVWTNRDKLDPSLPITPYIFTITKRLALNSIRQIANSQKAVDELWKGIEDRSNLTEEAILLNDLQKFTDTKISLLPPQQQQIFKLSRYEGLSYDEIAKMLGLSKNTVRNHLSLALKTLRKHLNEPQLLIFAGLLKNFEIICNYFHLPLVHLRF